MTSTLELALGSEHAGIRQLAAPAHAADAGQADRRHQTDWFYAITSQHLAAAEDVLLAEVRRLPDGRRHVSAYVDNARQLGCALRLLKGRQYGDGRALHLRYSDVWRAIDDLLTEHERIETAHSGLLGEKLGPEALSGLSARLLTASAVAPTRAHPHSPHTGRSGWLAHRFWRLADSTWDDLEGRVVPARYVAHPKRDSTLAHYLRGGQVPLAAAQLRPAPPDASVATTSTAGALPH